MFHMRFCNTAEIPDCQKMKLNLLYIPLHFLPWHSRTLGSHQFQKNKFSEQVHSHLLAQQKMLGILARKCYGSTMYYEWVMAIHEFIQFIPWGEVIYTNNRVKFVGVFWKIREFLFVIANNCSVIIMAI